MKWPDEIPTLQGQSVDLIPMEATHFDGLLQAALEEKIWVHFPYNGGTKEEFRQVFNAGLTEKEKGTRCPFIILHKEENKFIGSTSLIGFDEKNRKTEIGATWLHPNYWGTLINPECKLLLLGFCFEQLHTARVQLKTDALNLRSRRAIEKIGASFEGILRNDMIRENQTKRNSAYFSIIEEEWLDRRKKLETITHAP